MIRISHSTGIVKGEINLPSSKSISNRMLILQKLYEPDIQLDNVSNANDTQLLKKLLDGDSKDLFVEDAGTVFRFMVAYCATTPGEWTINGIERLNERPIKELVDALRLLGADISYSKSECYGPLKIVGKELAAVNDLIDLTHVKSSQFISALLLIAPMVKGDFNIKVDVKMSSYSYILLTVSCLRRMGFSVFIKGMYISVSKKQKFDGEYFLIEPDWSSFYYWFSISHLSKECDLFFPGLRLDNMQKERKYLFEVGNNAMTYEEKESGIRISKSKQGKVECPDILHFAQRSDSAMTYGMLLPAIGCKYHKLKGLESLKYKECDREEALTEHLAKVGVQLSKIENEWELKAENYKLQPNTMFPSYDDHRMAMCVAPLGLEQPILVEDETVVKKSYPHFWEDLESVGFEIEQVSSQH